MNTCTVRDCLRAPFEGIAVCREHAERLVGRKPEPEAAWIKRAREAKLPVKIRWAA